MSNIAAARVSAAGALILGASWLAGCASLSEAECLSGDWRVIGFRDGTAGQPPGRVGQHGEACARYGVAPNLDVWRIGYEEGLSRYCTRPSGFFAGVQGSAYHGVCTGPAADEFLIAYRDGQQVYDVRQALARADADRDDISAEIDRVRYERDHARADADAEGISRQDRQAFLDRAERLSERLGELRREREDIEYSRQRIQSDMWSIEAQMRSYYPEWNGY